MVPASTALRVHRCVRTARREGELSSPGHSNNVNVFTSHVCWSCKCSCSLSATRSVVVTGAQVASALSASGVTLVFLVAAVSFTARFGSTAAMNMSSCSGQCQAGYSCPAGSKNAAQSMCTAGRWSASGAATCTSCSAGLYSSTLAATSATACVSCAPGYFGNTTGLMTVTCSGQCLGNSSGLCFWLGWGRCLFSFRFHFFTTWPLHGGHRIA